MHEAILNCIRSVYHSREEILQAMQAAEKKVLFIGEQKEDPEAIRRKIQHIEQEMGSLHLFLPVEERGRGHRHLPGCHHQHRPVPV